MWKWVVDVLLNSNNALMAWAARIENIVNLFLLIYGKY